MSKTIFVCGACGKTAKDKYDFKDASCFLNSVECLEDSLKFDKEGRVIYADPIPKSSKQTPNKPSEDSNE